MNAHLLTYKVKANLFKNIPGLWFKTVHMSFEPIDEQSYSFYTKDEQRLKANILEKTLQNILIAISEDMIFTLISFLLGLYLYHTLLLIYALHLGIYALILGAFAWNFKNKKLITNETISFVLCQILGFAVFAKLFFFDFYIGSIFLYITFVFTAMFIMRFYLIKDNHNIKLLSTIDGKYFFIVDFSAAIKKEKNNDNEVKDAE